MDADPRIGTEIAGFRIEALVGRGGMGVVYRAEQLRLGRKVALKLLAPELSEDEAFRDRFTREWHVAAQIDHPNIVPIYEAGEAEGVLYIAMRYVDGADLRAVLRQAGRLTPDRALAILAPVASALDAAHSRDLVHRDVKPGNILIASGIGPEEHDHVYLSDFGVAKQVRTASGLTRTGVMVGTLEYAAPEQIQGKDLDGRADQYSLACVLYHCLTGAVPFEKDSDVAMLYAHLLEPPPSVSERLHELPAALDAVIAKAMAKSSDDRFPTCRAFVAAAREALAGATMPLQPAAPPPMPPTAVGASPSPPPPTPPSAAEAATTADPDRTLAGPPAAPPPGAQAPAPRRRRLSRKALAGVGAVVLVAGVGVGGIIASGGGDGESAEPPAEEPPAVVSDTGVAPADGSTAGTVLFTSNRYGDFDVFSMDADGKNVVQLTSATVNEYGGVFDATGTRFVYTVEGEGIFVANADGSGATLLYAGAEPDLVAWSPDGTTIAYGLQGEPPDIWTISADGGTEPTLFIANATGPVWSPDGSQIAFVRDSEIYVADADGTDDRQLTDTGGNAFDPDWSADGTRITFDGVGGIFVVNADGTGLTQVTAPSDPATDFGPRWTPDGARIVFTRDPDGSFETALDWEIYAVDAEAVGNITQLTDDSTNDLAWDVGP
jgi:serine/threonine-protein kinase